MSEPQMVAASPLDTFERIVTIRAVENGYIIAAPFRVPIPLQEGQSLIPGCVGPFMVQQKINVFAELGEALFFVKSYFVADEVSVRMSESSHP